MIRDLCRPCSVLCLSASVPFLFFFLFCSLGRSAGGLMGLVDGHAHLVWVCCEQLFANSVDIIILCVGNVDRSSGWRGGRGGGTTASRFGPGILSTLSSALFFLHIDATEPTTFMFIATIGMFLKA